MPCPFKGVCGKRVKFEFYQSNCNGIGYRTCPEYKEQTDKELRPKDWDRKMGKEREPWVPWRTIPWRIGEGCCNEEPSCTNYIC